ncbi:MAG: L-seryl-tRNA(Sec) selenium transferase [Acidobacteriota bacterium]|nr:L-seryl-tRNA(Sec) selenium transferase [Acidobacteriota bacterium]
MTSQEQLRDLPSVDELVSRIAKTQSQFPRSLLVAESRRVLANIREAIRRGEYRNSIPIEDLVERSLHSLQQPSLQRVINATGVVLHTNLGRAPLARFDPLFGYSNLEYDVAAGRRGKRDVHLTGLLDRLVGASGIAVNNNAAAIYLALNELAAGYEVVVSRGELIEIGDGFRIPDIMRSSGALLREVGTTNRTRIEDYREAITERTRLLLRVHPSNFRMQGFTSKPELRELVALGKERGIPVYEDLGSGCIADLRAYGIEEPLVSESLHAGVNLVSFSGDKLLGGPQAGVLAGDAPIVTRLRRNPMFRALRLDKLIHQALETTLRNLLLERWDEVPALRMIRLKVDDLRTRADHLASTLNGVESEVIPGQSVVGGGATPEQSLATYLIAVDCADIVDAERRCRAATPPVIARIEDNRLLFDLRTVFPQEEEELRKTIVAAVHPSTL